MGAGILGAGMLGDAVGEGARAARAEGPHACGANRIPGPPLLLSSVPGRVAVLPGGA